MADLSKLKAELAKPEYTNLNDVAASKLVNQPDRQVNKETITNGEIVVAIFPDFGTLTPEVQANVSFLIQAPHIPLNRAVRDFLNDMFPPVADGRQRVRTALKRAGSRAEESALGRVTESDVADARRLP